MSNIRWWRRLSPALTVIVASGLLQVLPFTPQVAAQDDSPPRQSEPVPGALAPARPRPVDKVPAPRKAAATWPAAGASAGAGVQVKVLGRDSARNAGTSGPLFTLAPTTGLKAPSRQVTLDYTAFAELYGGAYASRLTLAELPACALTAPAEPECRVKTPVETVNDVEKHTLTARRAPLRAGAPTVLAAVSAAAGDKGDYTASPLSPSATWATDLNTGDFGWSYPIAVPDVPGGLTPDLKLSYSSGAIDGRTSSTNNQASWIGDGFELSPGYIERRYKPCSEDGVKNADGFKIGDLCWAYDNAFISFDGKGGELVPDGKDTWKFRGDDGSRIQRLYGGTGDVRDNGARKDEYWKLTTPDGVQYYFGYNRLPGWSSGKPTTGSTWTVPVFGDDAGEECHADKISDSWCQQGWRWNLDYVVDPHGNAMAYYYEQETNSYGRFLDKTNNTRYVRGGVLKSIEYGLRKDTVYTTAALAKVNFTSGERCLPDSATGATCSSIEQDAFHWYDTPWDLNCESGEDCDEGRMSPAFFTRKRLTAITTEIGGKKADSWAFTHRWGMADTDYQLLLSSIQRSGHTATPAITLPKIAFTYTQRDNRLDKTGDGYAPFIKERLKSISDEAGGQIDVVYSEPDCGWNKLPVPQTNTTRCFPQYLGGSSTDDPELSWFNKYVVTDVILSDRTGGAADQVTSYDYKDGAAWHYDDDDGLTKEKFKTWSQWRGYGHVQVRTGGAGGVMKTQSDTYFLRGMHGDRKGRDSGDGTKTVEVKLEDGEGDPITDHESAAGFAYKTVTYSGPGGTVLAKTVTRPWHRETAKKERDWGTITANFTGTAGSKSWTSLDGGKGDKWRTTSVANTYDTVAGRLVSVNDLGDGSTAADDTCTRTTYATDSGLLMLPARVETVAKACGATATRPDDVITDIRSAYDGSAYGTAPSKGDPTATAVLRKYSGTTAIYLESGSAYDGYGRVTSSTDLTADVKVTSGGTLTRTARTDGRTTTTQRAPATGVATTVTTTTPRARPDDPASTQVTVTTFNPARGLPTRIVDTNGNTTNLAYDALGRTSKVWLPDRLTGQTPTYEFTYSITGEQAAAVGTKTIGNLGEQQTSYTLFDGFLRPRQTQSPGPEGGLLISDTLYDERGLIGVEFATYYTKDGKAGQLFKPANALTLESQFHHLYDGLGRETEVKQIAGNSDGGQVLSTTRTVYGGDRVTVIPPQGGTATTTVTDARGRTVELHQHHQREAGAAADVTTFAYNPAGKLEQVKDPAGNTWTYAYDLLGRLTDATDPDKGATHNDYDERGQLTLATDARGSLAHLYDGLGRRTQLRTGSATGELRAEWTYDTVKEGRLSESTRHASGRTYTSRVTEYDRLYRPVTTEVAIDAAEGALGGTYRARTSYKVSGLPEGSGYPAAGSLPAATVSYAYEDVTLRPATVNAFGVTGTTSYSYTGKPLTYRMSVTGGKLTEVANAYEYGTQRLASSTVHRQDVPGADQSASFRYDQAGNVLSVSDVSAPGTDTQCFAYDYLRRLTEAWAQATTSCTGAPSPGGPAPYWHTYSYDKVGNRVTETQHDPTGGATKDVTRTYAYPEAGKPRPHAVTSITPSTGAAPDTFDYDETGNTRTRVVAGKGQTLVWDAEGHLAKVTDTDGKVTEYLYDADGNRLIGRTPTETTLYLGSTEITLAKGATATQATRYLDLGGGHQAVQKDNGSVSFTIADHHGTGNLAVDATTLNLTQRRTLPFGGPRGTPLTLWPGTKGFVGGIDDTAATGLTHLGAREYDPAIGRFLSVDPIMDLAEPQKYQGYAYAGNNPLTYSDPSGLDYGCGGGSCEYGSGGRNKRPDDDTIPDAPRGSGGGMYVPRSNGGGGGGGGGGHAKPRYRAWVAQDDAVVIENVRVPTQAELMEKWRTDDPDMALATWASAECNRGMSTNVKFCGAARDLGFFDGLKRGGGFSLLGLLGVEDAVNCVKGSGSACAWTAVDIGLSVAISGLGKVAGKVAKAAKVGAKRGDVVEDVARACRNSFVPETRVLMADGTTKPIKDVKAGDKVIATDPETGRTGPEPVTGTITSEGVKRLVRVSLRSDDGGAVIATEHHPFWVDVLRQWVTADALQPGQWLRTSAGTYVQITAVTQQMAVRRVHNLSIAGPHTYYVLAATTPVLVHNSPRCDPWRSYRRFDDNGHPVDGTLLPTDEALEAAQRWLGPGYTEPVSGSGRYVSRDGTRIARIGESDITGQHGGGPHMNLERMGPNPRKPGKSMVVENRHIYLE
ncbi:YD repeat protein [[Actinomadura] parvosata subsp. kistnae]|uniref:polymorphic toxin-type HINT domain-containing protein n=1 Tax=[Actinomadura] parvosata TaxID=1955412 RepID=UPI000D281653|nr:YD repeat protein [Actinomadura parvosata subsp. kistnae]